MKEEVRHEMLKLLEAGMIYPISDSSWVSPIQVVHKKGGGGIIVVKSDKNEFIPTRIVIGRRMCVDCRRLNNAIRKDHFPFLSWTRCLRFSRQAFYCFLDGYKSYN